MAAFSVQLPAPDVRAPGRVHVAAPRVVLIEDSETDALMVHAMLGDGWAGPVELVWTRTLAAGVDAIRDDATMVVLVDLGLPDSDGMETVEAVCGRFPDTPVVVMTGNDDAATGSNAVGHGAQDYLVKGKTDTELLVRTITYAVERKRAELAQRRSEERFRALIQHATDLVMVCDRHGAITFVSPAIESVLGYDPDDLMGVAFTSLAHEDDAGEVARVLAVRPWAPAHEVCRLATASGSWRWIEVVATNLIALPAVNGVVINGRDVTARRTMEGQLQESEGRLAAILDALPLSVVVARPDGTTAYANEAFRRLTSSFVGDNPFLSGAGCFVAGSDTPYPSDGLPVVRAFKDEDGNLADLELDAEGRRVPLRVRFVPVRGRDGEVALAVAVADDITEERESARRLAEQAAQLARSNAELEQFAYVASHDLSEPLRTIAGFVQLLAERYEGQLDDDADEFLGFIVEGVSRMRALIQDLLNYSRVSRLAYTMAEVDTGALVSELAASLAGDGAIACGPLPRVVADATQLRRVFQNLIVNALKFVHPERAAEVRITARSAPTDWVFSVEDNGIGIPESQRERIFKMFQRLHTEDEYPGTGIGLAVCQRIVERHGGRIWAESTVGAGSSFRFSIPKGGAGDVG